MADKTNTEERLKKAIELKRIFRKKSGKSQRNSKRREEFKIQLEKVDALIKHLEKELEE